MTTRPPIRSALKSFHANFQASVEIEMIAAARMMILIFMFLTNVKVMAHPLAGANVDRGVGVETRWKHR
jgi:hypothetical protein